MENIERRGLISTVTSTGPPITLTVADLAQAKRKIYILRNDTTVTINALDVHSS